MEVFAQVLDDRLVFAVPDELFQSRQLVLLLEFGLRLELLEFADELVEKHEQ